jgi:hypothetical protein
MVSKVSVCVRRGAMAAAIAAALLLPTRASAQAVVDAGRVEFTPSADHNATSGGVPVLTSYEFQVFVVGSSQMTRSVNLGKPAPETDGFIRVDFLSLLSTPLAPNVQYQARVASIGPGGASASAFSNEFSFTPACDPTLSSTSASVPATASTGSVTVNVASGCTWSATSPVSWVSITSGAGGTGTGQVNFSVSANTTSSARSATLTIATRSFNITQAGCSYAIAPTSRNSPAGGETTSVDVTTDTACTWSATSNAGWLTVNGGSNRTGGGGVSVVVAANASTSPRTGTATIAGRTFTVNQAGACSYAVAPTSISPGVSGGTTTVTVTTGSTCTWGATSNATWITVSGGTNRTGTGNVTINVAANASTSPRTGTATVAGRTVNVNQAGCTYTVNPTTISPEASGGTTTVTVTTGTACTWGATSNATWITVNGGTNRTGTGNVTIDVAANTSTTPRTGTATVAGRTVTVDQAGACAYTVVPTTISASAAGVTDTISVTTGTTCSWSVTGVPSWMTISTSTQTGTRTLSYTIATNPAATSRSATLTVAGRTVSVTQAGATTTPSTPTGLKVVGRGG